MVVAAEEMDEASWCWSVGYWKQYCPILTTRIKICKRQRNWNLLLFLELLFWGVRLVSVSSSGVRSSDGRLFLVEVSLERSPTLETEIRILKRQRARQNTYRAFWSFPGQVFDWWGFCWHPVVFSAQSPCTLTVSWVSRSDQQNHLRCFSRPSYSSGRKHWEDWVHFWDLWTHSNVSEWTMIWIVDSIVCSNLVVASIPCWDETNLFWNTAENERSVWEQQEGRTKRGKVWRLKVGGHSECALFSQPIRTRPVFKLTPGMFTDERTELTPARSAQSGRRSQRQQKTFALSVTKPGKTPKFKECANLFPIIIIS